MMKLCRYRTNDGIQFGLVNKAETGILRLSRFGIEGDGMKAIIDAFFGPMKLDRTMLKAALDEAGDDLMENVELLAPVDQPPGRIICLGKNYRDHANEVKSFLGKQGGVPTAPIYFGKMVNRIMGHDEILKVDLSNGCELDYEVEMALFIGKEGTNITPEEAEAHIFAYTVVNDLTDRAAQRRHEQWLKGKSIDNTFPMGAFLLLADTMEFPPNRKIRSFVNGELRQEASTDYLIFSIEEILSDLSKNFTLYPGDIILTGTPAGVGMGFTPPKALQSGDCVDCEIEGIGWLKNRIEGI
ncbi:fumarylacetoacetate hydrolase family protein [Gottschalkiaceae bacterium SANA]|nr:fumarylacetoacetate hydrolase family protein [Gottschalkiaceae bacterium SANA]